MQLPKDLTPFETYLLENDWTYYTTHDNGYREYKDVNGRPLTLQAYNGSWILHPPGFGFRHNQSENEFHNPTDLTPDEYFRLMQVVDFKDLVSMTKHYEHMILAENDKYYHVRKWPYTSAANRKEIHL